MTNIAVVILNWNGRHYLQQFLPSVCKYSDFPDTEIIVADNGSTDDSVNFLKENFPSVRIIEFNRKLWICHGLLQGTWNRLMQIIMCC